MSDPTSPWRQPETTAGEWSAEGLAEGLAEGGSPFRSLDEVEVHEWQEHQQWSPQSFGPAGGGEAFAGETFAREGFAGEGFAGEGFAGERAEAWREQWAEQWGEGGGQWGEDETARCTPAAPDPARRGILVRSLAAERTPNSSVGYAQQQLNKFLDGLRAGASTCTDRSPATVQYMTALLGKLRAARQDTLTVDCKFGANTELATKLFQACNGVVRDGKIGPITWALLERVGGGTPGPTPGPGPTPQPTSGVRERRDVWTLSAADPWHPTILWYARGVAALQARNGTDFADPMCWRHLAEAHGSAIARASWPRGAKWNACEHGSWFFLPWHRIYLHHFEKIMRAAIAGLGGPSDWALPYWNYSDGSRPDVRSLPPAFRQPTMPDGRPNPLFISQRAPGVNTGTQMDERFVSTTAALGEGSFTGIPMSFGGGDAPVGTHGGFRRGQLELHPHGDVHVMVGGDDGWMSDFDTAGRDPIFWLHHANIDRLWEAWLRQPSRRNTTDRRWLDGRFEFGSGGATTSTSLRVSEVIDPRRAPLEYRYSDMPITPTGEMFEEPAGEAADRRPLPGEEVRPLELVGATEEAVPLGATPSGAVIAVSGPSGPLRKETGEAGLPADARVYLRLENITGTRRSAGIFEVFVNVPAGARAADFPDRRAGHVSMFGVIESSQKTDQHSGSGLDATFDITRIVRTLSAAGAWDPKQVRVSFTPVADAAGNVREGDVKVGRISLFVS